MLQDHDFTPYFFEKRWALNHGYFIERQLKKNDLFVNGLASLILTTFVNYSSHRNKTNSKQSHCQHHLALKLLKSNKVELDDQICIKKVSCYGDRLLKVDLFRHQLMVRKYLENASYLLIVDRFGDPPILCKIYMYVPT